MAKKISQLGLAADVTVNDLFQVVDKEDTSMSPSGTNKRITAQTLGNFLPVTATGSSASRSLKDRFADILDAKDFGAEGTGEIVLNVPAQYATIRAAFTYLSTKRIASGTTVKIQVADGTYTLTSSINANHPDGSQIQLLGNQTTAANCVLQVVGQSTFDAIAVSSGNVLGFLNGFRIRSTVKALVANNTTGVLAVQNATIICGTKIEVDNFYYGIASKDGSYIYCPSAVVTNAGDVGIWAYSGSTIVANNATSNNCSDAVNPWGFGFQAEFGSTLVATNAQASGNKIGGIAALSNSTCRVNSEFGGTTTCNANGGSGFFARNGGTIEAYGAVTEDNTRYGLEIVDSSGEIYGIATNTGNGEGAANNFAFIGETGGVGRIASSVGGLRVDTSDTSSIFFHNSNGLQFEVRGTNANTVNRIQASGNSLGNAPFLVAEGSSSTIDLGIFPKGAGSYVQLGAGYFTQADSPTTGYIQVKDNNGVVRKLAVIA